MRKILRFCLILIGFGAVFLIATVAPVHRYRVQDEQFYREMLTSIRPLPVTKTVNGLQAGAARVSLTPRQRTATAGYGNRRGKLFHHIDDSVFVRTLLIRSGPQPVAIVAADLLIIPPLVRADLEERLPGIGFSIDQVYLGATHSHNSIGNWSKGITSFLYGAYSDSIVRFISDQIIYSIQSAAADLQPAQLSYQAVRVPEAVRNRLNEGGPVDSLLHVVRIDRADRKKFLLTSFAAHATCLPSAEITLSRDYPGHFVELLETAGFDHVQFMAGAVGSQTTNVPDEAPSCIEYTAAALVRGFLRDSANRQHLPTAAIQLQHLPLRMPEVQAKISRDWRLRPWVFHALMGDSEHVLSVLKAGPLVMVGTPCDFSGELVLPLYQHARQNQIHLMVTSFNGGYMGYITPDQYYDKNHYETRLMNWYGPGNGTYFSDCIRKIVDVNSR